MLTTLDRVAPAGSRQCGDCGACCKTHAVRFDSGFVKAAGKWCHHWKKGVRCSIYEDRPGECRVFQCNWLKGAGAEEHRPDRTRVVPDFVLRPDGPPSGVLQMFEAVEGALNSKHALDMTRLAFARGVPVLHIFLSGRKKIFIPPGAEGVHETTRSAYIGGFEICHLDEL